MSSTSKRLLAAALCVVMMLSLFIPAGAVAETEELGHDHAEEAAIQPLEELEELPVVDEEDASASLLAVQVHDFTASGTSSTFYTISGNLSTGKGTVTYEGKKLTQCLKLESATNITFNATEAGTLTLVFVETAPTIKVDGTRLTGSGGIITTDLTAGSHTIAKADTANLFYMSYGSNCDHAGTSYTVVKAATCSTKGEQEGTCPKCGNKVTEEIAIDPTAHVYKNGTSGICQECGKDSASGAVHSHTFGPWEIVKEPTCKEEGVQEHTCTNADCGKSEQEALDRLPHEYGADGKCKNCGAEKTEDKFLKAAGHLESAYIEWSINTDYVGYNVYVIDSANQETRLDDELIRQYPGFMRADALGLKAGNYKLKVVPVTSSGENKNAAMTTDTLKVLAQDRSGYAFTGNDTPGAYKADGTLKDGAVVVYITEKTKDTVTIPGVVDSKKNVAVGIGAIVQCAYKKKDNTTPPICFRLIGNITDPANLGSGDLYVDGGSSAPGKPNPCKGLTIEGVGNDAVCNGFGIVLKGASYTEVRNLGMMNCDSNEKDEIGLQQNNTYCWVHNNDIFYGHAGSDGDQAKGDGALDTKKSTGITHSYNHFWDCGKCNLQGMKEETAANTVTYHHNWYDHSDSRHPRVRTCTVHTYNNYFDGNAKYGIGAAMQSSIFIENNYFRNCPSPSIIGSQGHDIKDDGGSVLSNEGGGMVKMYGNTIIGATKFTTYDQDPTNFDAYIAKTRDEKVPATVKANKGGHTYSNFDTASDFYKYTPDSPEEARDKVIAYAGRVEGGDFQWTFTEADDKDYDVNKELKAALMSYKTELVSVGGTIKSDASATQHTVANWSAWTVTTPATCSAYGVETRSCTYPGCTVHAKETRAVPPAAHSYKNGVCENCGAKEGDTTTTTPVKPGVTSGKGYVLKYTDFTAPATDSVEVTADEIAKLAEGYFKLYGDKVLKRIETSDKASNKGQMKFIQLTTGGANGIEFTVKNAPATVVVNFSATGDTQHAALGLVDKDGNYVKTTDGKDYTDTTGTAKAAIDVKYEITTAGTYRVVSPKDDVSTNSARLYTLTVTEAAQEEPPAPPCQHTYGAWTVVRAATCGADGWQEHACSKCGEKEGAEIDATGLHTWGAWGDADEDGILTRACSVCGEEQSKAAGEPDPVDPVDPGTKPGTDPGTDPGTKPGTDTVAVTGVTLNRSAASVTAGNTLTLTATVAPSNATNQGVYWTSGDTKILTVSDKGVVTGVAAGKATVTVTTLDGNFTDVCTVTVDAASGGGSKPSGSGGGGGGSVGGGSPSGGSTGGGTTTTPTPTDALPFVDVPANVWYVDSVKTIYAMGLMKGTDATHFAPNDTTTRAMVATVLYRLDGEKDADVASLFSDVVAGSWYEKAVQWAAEKGVVKGYSENVFAPNDNVTREQLAVMLYRYANAEAATVDLSAKFADAASVSDWAADAIAWAVDKGILNGKGDGTLDPQGLATRAEICAMLVRFVALNK